MDLIQLLWIKTGSWNNTLCLSLFGVLFNQKSHATWNPSQHRKRVTQPLGTRIVKAVIMSTLDDIMKMNMMPPPFDCNLVCVIGPLVAERRD
jgi:hypothetical protein